MNLDWQNLIESLKKKGVLKTPSIIEAFEKIDRKDFVLGEYKDMAYIDEALPTLGGQTISQPYTVAFMLELLQPKAGDKILDIGAGSGWQTALLAYIVGEKGEIYSMEIIPEVCEFGKTNVSKYNFIEKGIVEWFCQSAEKGLPEKAPFDGIIAAAALGNKAPDEWLLQLKQCGRLVVPIKNSIWLFVKKSDNNFEQHEYQGFTFVPFV
jgi:protein-L-isoaspartate(D-aspartate) O-methyltransferase